MNELYKLLQNIHEIAIANNRFLQSFEERMQRIEVKMQDIEGQLSIDISSVPDAPGAEIEKK
jgi:hypothetical protein